MRMRGLAVLVSLVASGCPSPLPDIETESMSSGANDTVESTTAAVDSSTTGTEPSTPVLTLGFSQVKQLDFSWDAVQGADHYELLERLAPGEEFTLLAGDLVGESISLEMPLHLRWEAGYVLRACNDVTCSESDPVDVMGSLVEAVGYVKASNTQAAFADEFDDGFSDHIALSGDGNTLAIGAIGESSDATGINGDQGDNSTNAAGAVYVLAQDEMGTWSQQAYVKASNTDAECRFGSSVTLSGDGNTLAIGAIGESSAATGIGGNQDDNSAVFSGAVYVFARDGVGAWSQEAYVKASNTDAVDYFGSSVALSGDGNTLAVGATGESSNATGIGGNQVDNSAGRSGAVYLFGRSVMGTWSSQAYVKASNTGAGDQFGHSVALSADGNTLAVGAWGEESSATGIGGNPADDSAPVSGSVYVFARDDMGDWAQQAYVKATNTEALDMFGWSVALSGDGNTLAVGAHGERSNATGIGGNQADNIADGSGAVYVFVRNVSGTWSSQAYVKASNTGVLDMFGWSVALNGDGNILSVGARGESSNATGINGNQADDSASESGAAYVFVRDGIGAWSQQAYVKAPNTDAYDEFGVSVTLSQDGNTLAVGAGGESSDATGIAGDQANDDALSSGAVYLY